MAILTIDPIKPFAFGFQRFSIFVVGAGGTGGYVLQSLARLLVHLGRPDDISVFVLDGDHVEQKNVGRQLFSHAEIGRNKAETLVRRFNTAFGLQMMAIPEMATTAMLDDLIRNHPHRSVGRYSQAAVFCGCVDTTAAREVIHRVSRNAWLNHSFWLDCGNDDQHGQVLFGKSSKDECRGTLATDFCTALPRPSVLYPALIAPKPAPVVAVNCAVDLADNRQSLNINQMIATVASQYLTSLLVEQRITRYETTVDLSTMSMASKAITATNLARSLDVEPAFLTTKGR